MPSLPSLEGPLCEQLWTQTRILMGNGSYKETPPTMQEPTPGVVGPGVCSPRARWELGSRLRGGPPAVLAQTPCETGHLPGL